MNLSEIGKKARVAVVFLIFLPLYLSGESREPSLEKSTFEEKDRPWTILTVRESGKYSIEAASKTGTMLSLIDRMAGLLNNDGDPGKRDGRIDILLEKGEYRVELTPDPKVPLKVTLSCVRYKEMNPVNPGGELPRLDQGDFLEATLGDHESRSFWVIIKERKVLYLEALARNLSDSRLFVNGELLVPANPSVSEYSPIPGMPMRYIEYYELLEPGSYLLVFYGGKPRGWTNETSSDTAHSPFYLRCGIPYIGENGLKTVTVSPFGREAFWVSGAVNYAELSREEKKTSQLRLGNASGRSSRHSGGDSAAITEKSEEPRCVINGSGYHGNESRKVVEVIASPGDKLFLSYYAGQFDYSFSGNQLKSKYILETISGPDAQYYLDSTPIVIQTSPVLKVLKNESVILTPAAPYVRRINLLGEASVFIALDKDGTLCINEKGGGAKARYWFEPMEDYLKGKYNYDKKYAESGKDFSLAAGTYVLHLYPSQMGILHFALYYKVDISGHQNLDFDPKKLLDAAPPLPKLSFLMTDLSFPADLEKSDIWVKINSQSGLPMNMLVKPLPLPLEESFAFLLAPSQSVTVPVTVKADSVLFVEGKKPVLSLNGKEVKHGAALSGGSYTLTLTNGGPAPERYSVFAEPKPAPVSGKIDKRSIADMYPVITEGKPFFDDYNYNDRKSFCLVVKEPAMYRLETSGRLSTMINVRTALRESLFATRMNGTGRNALVQEYFRPGEYLVSAGTVDQSRGRAGLHLKKTPLLDGGTLVPGQVLKHTVEQDVGVKYLIRIDEPGTYYPQTYGLGVSFSARLEDGDGWPLVLSSNNLYRLRFEKGDYVLYSLPADFKTIRIAALEPEQGGQACPDSGGPCRIEFNREINRTFNLSESGNIHRYLLDVSSAAPGSIYLSGGVLASVGKKGAKEDLRLNGGTGAEFNFEQGQYEISVRSVDDNDRLPYKLFVATRCLIPGLELDVNGNAAEFSVSVPGDQLVRFTSSGRTDLKAVLTDEQGTAILAENDDMENDWNFGFSIRLQKGLYRLKVMPAGEGFEACRVRMDTVTEEKAERKRIPFAFSGTLKRNVLIFPFTLPGASGLVRLANTSGAETMLALYRDKTLLASSKNTIVIPLEKERAYTLYLWQETGSGGPVSVSCGLEKVRSVTLDAAEKRLDFTTALALSNPLRLSYRLKEFNEGILFSPGKERPCYRPGLLPFSSADESGWLVPDGQSAAVTLKPLSLNDSQAASLDLDRGPQSFIVSNADPDHVLLIEAKSPGSLLGAYLAVRTAYKPSDLDWKATDVAPSSTIVCAYGTGTYQGRVWNAEQGAAMGTRAEVSAWFIPLQESLTLKDDVRLDLQIEPGKAVSLIIGQVPGEISLILERGAVAFTSNKGRCEAIAPAREETAMRNISVSGGICTIINTLKFPALARVDFSPLPASTDGKAGELIDSERFLSARENLSLRITPVKGIDRLCVSGDEVNALLKGDDGYFRRGRRSAIEGRPYLVFPLIGGDLEISAGPGYVRVFAAPEREMDRRFARIPAGLKPKPVSGSAQLSNKPELWSLKVEEPCYVSLETVEPGLSALLSEKSAVLSVAARGTGGGRYIFHYLEPGGYTLFTRPFDGKPQGGKLTVRRIVPVMIGDPPDTALRLIGAFEKQVFQFKVTVHGLVGVGLKVESDNLNAVLFDGKFRNLSSGPLMYLDLEPGTYYLLVEGTGVPMQFAPLILGGNGSIVEIPRNVVETYTKGGEQE
jgi:hypothetical protein